MSVTPGIVIAVRPRWVRVRTDQLEYDCQVPKTLKRGRREQRTLLAVGDRVEIEIRPGDEAVVRALLPRSSRISRVSSLRPPREQVIAANVGQLLALQSVDLPRFNARALDRLLVVGEVGGVDCAICINKIDLCSAEGSETAALVAPYRGSGYPIFLTSAIAGDGLGPLAEFLRGRETILLGPSGCGKTALLSRFLPGRELRARRVSASSGKGRHTTSRIDYYDLPEGGAVLDTPGLRAIQPWTTAHDLATHFPEMRPFLGHCRFPDCLHRGEPSCAVHSAVARGEIDGQRHASYVRILESLLVEGR